MKGFLNFFARWVVPVLGLLALSLIIWFLGPLLRLGNYEPLASATSRWVLIVLLFLVWIGFRVLRIVQARRNAAKVMQSLAEVSAPDAASVATAEELATLKQRMDEALALLKRAKLGGSERRNLYELPWYVIIGPPGSGKTTALMNSGLDFPLAAQMGAGAIRGVGGTRNCDWWFTDEAVLLDTAGRYTTQDSHAQVDKAAWLGFLDLLKTQRKRRPIDGAFIAISLSDLLLGSDAERAAHAQAIRARIQELYQQLGVRFPIYVMLTKFDLVPGFMEFFDSLNREERAQVWGMTFALDDGKSAEGPLAVFDSEFALLEQRLTARLVERLQQERDPARRDLVYGFPQQFAALRECLGEFLNGVFKPNPYEERPLLRGLYFTSGTQEGSPIDRLIGSMAQSMNLDRQHLARQTGTGRSYFIERLFREVAFGERGLVGTNPKVERRRKWLTIGALSATALVVLAVTAVWIASYRANQSYIAAVDQRVDPLARGIESLSPAQRDVLAVLPQLNAVQNLAGDAPSWAEGYGLYQGDMLGEESASVYRKLLIAVFAPRLVTRIEEQLRSGGSSDFLYEGLKAYLMLGSPDHYDADFIKAWISLDWERNLPRDLSPEQRQALHAHLDALLERRPPSARLDQDLVEDLRRQLQQLPVAQRVYDRVKRQRLPKDMPDFRISDAAGRDAPLVFARKSGKPLTDPLSGFFTYRGYREVFLTASLSQAGTIAEEQWVLGRDLNDAGDAANLALDVRRLYFQDYLRQWDDLLADLTVVPITNVTQAADVLRILSGPTSPFRKLLEAVARETDLQKGDRLVAAQVKKAADGTVDKLKQRLGSLVGQEEEGTREQPRQVDSDPISAHFAELNSLVSKGEGGNEPAPIDSLLEDMNALYVQVSAMAGASGDSLLGDAKNQVAAAASRVALSAERQPPVVQGLVKNVVNSTTSSMMGSVRNQLNAAWISDVVSVYRQSLAGRYPIAAGSSRDAT
ncbi:type VI secretion system membrane subunit TssM, partial [Pseudomonas aeruginosa]